jgi:hypothetical protein
MADRTAPKSTWRSLVVYLLVTPAALQVLARLDEHFEFSALIGRLLRAWRDFVHGIWADIIAVLQGVIPLHPTANQIDALSWIVLMLGAAATAAAFGPPSPVLRAGRVQAGVLFWLAFAVAAGIILQPYLPVVGHFFAAAIEDMGLGATLASVLVVFGIFIFSGANIIDKIREARALRANTPDLTPLWLDIEALLAPLLVGSVVGAVLALPVLESGAALDSAAAQSNGAFDLSLAVRNVTSLQHWQAVATPVVLIVVFSTSLLFVRRYNWPTMVRQVATAIGIVVADRLIALIEPLWRVFQVA